MPDNIKRFFGVKLFIFSGLVCVGQFYVFSLIGLFRGYSVQSHWPVMILLGGIFILLTPQLGVIFKPKIEGDRRCWISFLVSYSIIFISIVGILQGRFSSIGDELFDQGEYSAAIGLYQKEIDTWYMRLRYNYNEEASSFRVAECYCQMEEFDRARDRYKLIAERYKGYYKDRSIGEAAELDLELKNIAAFQEQLSGETEDEKKASILFDIALAYRRIGCDKRAKEQYAIIQTLDVHEGSIENAKKFAAGLDD